MHYKFENLILDTQLYQLIRDDTAVSIEPQVFDLLVYLIENRDRVVARDELLDKLWEGRVVSDSALSARLKAARKAVGDSGSAQKVIKTIHGRGYQFIAASTESAAHKLGPQKAESTKPIPLPPPDKPSIAVLPFQNLSNDPEQEYFSDGITEDVIIALSRISGLLVVARNSTMVYKGKAIDVKEIGREQGVRHVLEGSVRKGGNRIRVTAQLIDATTGHHQWAEHYDRELDDIFEVQDDITKQVTTELNVRLARGEEARVWARGTSNIEAWEKLIRVAPLSDDHVKEHNIEAQRLAGEAVHLDPNYATAWVGLGWTHWEDALWSWAESNDASISTALSCARRALEIDSEHPEALALLGCIYMTKKST
ncbi:winged helix-turn-helix domain-containing protein [Gammaproteobacteria bacterium]|nr:winged helix-turn-helix domain-containing protein [Gammaproteobacteria bacterium]